MNRFVPILTLTLAAVTAPLSLGAQHSVTPSDTAAKTTTDTAAKPAAKPAAEPADSTRSASKQPPAAKTSALDFSGVLFGNYQYRTDAAARAQNKFDVERAYLTFKMPAGERTSIRVTTDVFQQTSSPNDAYYRGWAIRAKYAYLQYDFLKTADWSAAGRIGLVQNMFIEHEEGFWLRWLSPVGVDRAGYFSSADAGVATVVTMPDKLGELYAAISNGTSYQSRETDRFKDYQARVTFTPLGASSIPLLRTLALTGWAYKGTNGSRFASGGTGQIAPVSSGLRRDRYGAFVALRDPRLTLGLDYARRRDQGESGLNTVASPRAVTDSTGDLISAYTVVRPFQMASARSTIPLGLVARLDRVKPNTATNMSYDTFIGGVIWDLSKKTSLSLDYQQQLPSNGSATAMSKTVFVHWVANF